MKFVYLTNEFYNDYDHIQYPEICEKANRPYTQTIINTGNLLFAIPLRSSIEHQNAYWTNKGNKCGLDFSKAVLILNEHKYIDQNSRPRIRPDEFKKLIGKEYIVKKGMEQYIQNYIVAKERLDIEHNKKLCQYSTLQYFEEYIIPKAPEEAAATIEQGL